MGEVTADQLLVGLRGTGAYCFKLSTPWWTLSATRMFKAVQRVDNSVVYSLKVRSLVRLVTRREEPHLGRSVVIELTDAGKLEADALVVERSLASTEDFRELWDAAKAYYDLASTEDFRELWDAAKAYYDR